MAETSSYKVAAVTGASRGIGAAICRKLRALGLEVHAVARDPAALERLAAETGCRVLVGDVTDHASLGAALAALSLDVLVNNAGAVPEVAPLGQLSAAAIDRMIDVNLRGPLQLMRAVVPGMIARRRGHIFNIGTTAASHVFPGTAPYAAAKAGLSAAARVLRYDLVGSGVRLTEIAPGRVATDIYLDAFAGDRPALRAKLYEDYRALAPEDVAAALAAALLMPEHADVTYLELSPTDQATGGHTFAKRGG